MNIEGNACKINQKNPRLRAMRCTYCMKAWIKNGRKPGEMPEAVYSADENGNCRICGNKFRAFIII